MNNQGDGTLIFKRLGRDLDNQKAAAKSRSPADPKEIERLFQSLLERYSREEIIDFLKRNLPRVAAKPKSNQD